MHQLQGDFYFNADESIKLNLNMRYQMTIVYLQVTPYEKFTFQDIHREAR